MIAIRTLFAGFISLSLASAALAGPEPKPSPHDIEFFETRIRPVLANHCFSCHGPEKQKADLRLDSREAVLKGRDTGVVVIAGNPNKSILVQSIRHQGDHKMPPKEKLPDNAIEALATWVKMGLPWPEKPGTDTAKIEALTVAEARKRHWAYQPVKKSEPPGLPRRDLHAGAAAGSPIEPAGSPIDRFVLAKLEEKGLQLSPPADRATLVRRATFDLIGLPPTPEEIASAIHDNADNWFEKVVDRLLASPHYGERWGRHWLDVARYADTKGYLFTEERRFPYSYTYRDYVIKAFNDDLPYDRFLIEQLAADQLPLGDNKGPLAAMGFLTLGRRFLNSKPDIIDDRIDVTMRGLLGLTVTCARCHDHKYDPIPMKDYYSLYGVFASSIEPKDLPLIGPTQKGEAFTAYEKDLKAREQKVTEFLQPRHADTLSKFRAQTAAYLLAAFDMDHPSPEFATNPANGELNPRMKRRWKEYLDKTRKEPSPIFGPWHAFAALPQKDFAAQAPALAAKIAANADKRVHPLVAKAFAEKPPTSMRDVAERYGELLGKADKLWQEAVQKAKDAKMPAPKASTDPQQESLRQVLYGAQMPANIPIADIQPFLELPDRQKLIELQKKVTEFKATAPAAPPHAMVLQDAPTPEKPHVFLRGNPNNPGAEVPRQFVQVLAGDNRKPFQKGSGRLEMAQAIASKDNPLTARVMVNRVWMHHFGAGLVRTPGEFGARGEPPTHPELLDYLAASFMDNGWSVKKLHRQIMLSRTYQQNSMDNPHAQQIDPENRLLWKVNRQRLDFEALRDAVLAVSGQLDPKQGGLPVDITKTPFSTRRTVYAFIERQNLPGMFRTFDFASPDLSTSQRFSTTVPQQALFLMNSPFVLEQAKHLAGRCAKTAGDEPNKRIQYLYRLLYGRAANDEEVKLGMRFVVEDKLDRGTEKLSAWERYAQVLLLSNEFVFVD